MRYLNPIFSNMKTRRSFTLVEILVTLTCATIVLAALVSSVVFISRMNKTAMTSSSTSFKIASIEDFIRLNADQLDQNSSSKFIYNENAKTISYVNGTEEILLFDKMDRIDIRFTKETKTDGVKPVDYIVVYINYLEENSNKVFSFLLKKAPQE